MDQPGKPWVRKHDYASDAIVARGRAYPAPVEEILAVVRSGRGARAARTKGAGHGAE
jgi:hypothetical protein